MVKAARGKRDRQITGNHEDTDKKNGVHLELRSFIRISAPVCYLPRHRYGDIFCNVQEYGFLLLRVVLLVHIIA